jgi:hypothetical protein
MKEFVDQHRTEKCFDCGGFYEADMKENYNKLYDVSKPCLLSRLPMELQEILLLRSFVLLYSDEYKKTLRAGELTYSSLGSVSFAWWQTMNGWPQSDTRHWFRHQLQQHIYTSCRPYRRRPELLAGLPTSGKECALAHMNSHIYLVWRFSDTIQVFEEKAPFRWMKDIRIPGMDPRCIVACPGSQRLYVVDWRNFCVLRVTRLGVASTFAPRSHEEDQGQQDENVVTSARPKSLSLNAGRLLVVGDRDLRVFQTPSPPPPPPPQQQGVAPEPEDHGVLVRKVTLPEEFEPQHAVETSRGTFIVSHTWRPLVANSDNNNNNDNDSAGRGDGVTEFDAYGKLLRSFGGGGHGRHDAGGVERLTWPYHIALDQDGRIFVADFGNRRVLMLNSDLSLEKIIVGGEEWNGLEDNENGSMKLDRPWRLCYVKKAGQLMVSEWLSGVKVFNLR